MIYEIIFYAIGLTAIFFFVRRIRKEIKGTSGCGSCKSDCSSCPVLELQKKKK